MGDFWGVVDFGLLLLVLGPLLEGGLLFFGASTALDSSVRDSQIFKSPRLSEVWSSRRPEASLCPRSSLTIGW